MRSVALHALGTDAINQLRHQKMLDGDYPTLRAYSYGLAVKIPYGARTEGRAAHAYLWCEECVEEATDVRRGS